MAQFPLQDKKDVLDAINYVLSGPSGLGQDFGSFASNGLSYSNLTGNVRVPYTAENTTTTPPTAPVPGIKINVAPIALGVSQMLDEYTWKYTFASAQPSAPFVNGQPIYVAGVANPDYDGLYSPIGVVDCTTTYVTARSANPFALMANSSGGTVELNNMNTAMSTDCNAFVTVNSNTSVVVLGLQLNNTIFYTTGSSGSFYYEITVNRYVGLPNQSNPQELTPGFYFILDTDNVTGASPYIAYKRVTVPTTAPSGNTSIETIFNNIIDQPGPGYYWYIADVKFINASGGAVIDSCVLSQRSFSLQVVKP